MKYNIKNLLMDIGDLGRDIYQSFRRNKMRYGLALTTSGVAALGMSGCCKKDDPEPEFKTEAQMSEYFESVVGNAAVRVDDDLRMTTTVPPTESSWVTISADYKVTGKDHRYVELVSTDDGLDAKQNAAIVVAKAHGLMPDVGRIYPGTASEMDKQINAIFD